MRRLWTYRLLSVNVAGTWLLSDMQISVLSPPEPADWSLTGLRGAEPSSTRRQDWLVCCRTLSTFLYTVECLPGKGEIHLVSVSGRLLIIHRQQSLNACCAFAVPRTHEELLSSPLSCSAGIFSSPL